MGAMLQRGFDPISILASVRFRREADTGAADAAHSLLRREVAGSGGWGVKRRNARSLRS